MTDLFGSTRGSTWFTADHYLGSEQAIGQFARPFDSVQEMNKTIIDRHNLLVEEQDVVWILGDLCAEDHDSLNLIAELNGVKYLIAGERDSCFAGHGAGKSAARHLEDQVNRYLDAGIKHVTTGTGIAKRLGAPVRVRLGDHRVDLAHFPHDAQVSARDDEFAAWRPRRVRGSVSPWLLHGDVHNAWRVKGRQINVGVDVWNYAPVPAEVVAGIIDEQDEHA